MDNIILRVAEDYEWIVEKNTGRVIAEGHKLTAEDVLFALGYRFEIEEVDDE